MTPTPCGPFCHAPIPFHTRKNESRLVAGFSYHVAFGRVFDGLDDPQPLFETHLLDDIRADGAKFLKAKREQRNVAGREITNR